MSVIKWLGTGLKYVLGVLCWAAVFAYLQFQCFFNVGSFVDSLWIKELHDGLVENLTGEIAYLASDGYGAFGCGARYIYSVKYSPRGNDVESDIRSLSSLVDVTTWRMVRSEGIITTFLDSRRKYAVRSISDGVDISAMDR